MRELQKHWFASISKRFGPATMIRAKQILLLGLCAALSASDTTRAEVKVVPPVSNFEIDSSKPYVYLEFDHVGPRKALYEAEPSDGIYLRLKNNCTLSIIIVALQAPPTDLDVATSIEDEVVPDPHRSQGDALGGAAYIQNGVPGLRDMDDILRWPNVNEAEVRDAEQAEKNATRGSKGARERPSGYNSSNVPGTRMLTLIAPGGQVYFSVPINHVGKTWHFEIPFRFALPRKAVRAPYSYVSFFQQDLSKESGTSRLNHSGT